MKLFCTATSCDDFVARPPSFRGRHIGLKRYPMDRGKEATFWHLISEGQVEAERLPNMRRCERIRWPRPMIHDSETNDLKIWRQERKGEQRVAIVALRFHLRRYSRGAFRPQRNLPLAVDCVLGGDAPSEEQA